MVAEVNLELHAIQFILRFLWAEEEQRTPLRAEGAELANRLRSEAMLLASSKATEFSPLVPLYHVLAAKMALLVYWSDDIRPLSFFEKDIECFAIFESSRPLWEEYERFRVAYTTMAQRTALVEA